MLGNMVKTPKRIFKLSKSTFFRLLVLWGPVFIWATVIFLFSAMTSTKAAEIHWQDFIIKKSAHIIEYGVLAMLLYRAFINSAFSKPTAISTTFFIAVLYAISDEFHQSFTPGREPTLRDIGFDTIGASLSLLLINKNLKYFPPRLRELAEKFELV